MGTSGHRASLAVAAMAFGVGACEAPGPALPSLLEVGPHLSVGAADPSLMCAGTWPYMDRYVGVLKAIHEVPLEYRVDYYWLPEIEDQGVCPVGHGCAYPGGTVYSKKAIEEHELVHAVRWFHDVSYSFIEEGAAEYWGADDWWTRPLEGETREAIQQADGEGLYFGYYGRAGHFVSYLAAEHGADRLLALTRESGARDDLAAFEAAFEVSYGVALDEAVEEYEAEYPVCPRWQFRSAQGVCSAQPTALCVEGEDDLRVRVSLSCDDPNTIGPRDGEIFTHVVFEIPWSNLLVLRVSGPDDGKAFLRQCEGGCGFSKTITVNEEIVFPNSGLESYPGGRYVMRLAVPEGTEGEFEVVVERLCRYS